MLELCCERHLRLWCGSGCCLRATAVRGQDGCGASRRSGGVSTVNSSEAPSFASLQRELQWLAGCARSGYSLQTSSGWGLPSALPKRLCSLPVVSEILSLSVSECVWSTEVAMHSQMLGTQIYCLNSEFQSLWDSWHLNKETKCLSLDNSGCCVHTHRFGCAREGRKLALTWIAKCSQTPKCSRCSRGMKDLQFAGSLLGRSRGLSAFEQQICNYVLKLLPGNCSCCWPLWNIQKLACCTMVIRKY